MTVKQVAEREGISERQAQRYCREGYKGFKLPAVRNGRGFQITESDYRAWRVACGFDPRGATSLQVSCATSHKTSEGTTSADAPCSPQGDEHPAPAPCAEYPPYPQPADPRGVLTNVPHEHSCNMPHPLACEEYLQEQARKLVAKYHGDEYAEPQE